MAGVGIIPTHCILQELSDGLLHEWKSRKDVVASSPIHLARRAELAMEMLIRSKSELG